MQKNVADTKVMKDHTTLVATKVVVRGQVQGVGFRAWTLKQAQLLGLVGWVRNLADGSVEALLQGDESQVEKMLTALRQGPRLSRVDGLEILKSQPSEDFADFSIKR